MKLSDVGSLVKLPRWAFSPVALFSSSAHASPREFTGHINAGDVCIVVSSVVPTDEGAETLLLTSRGELGWCWLHAIERV